MMTAFARTLFRDRRRLALFGVTGTLGAFILLSHDTGLGVGAQHSALAALGAGIAGVLAAVAVLWVAPSWRHLIETTGIAGLLYAMALTNLSGLALDGGTQLLAIAAGFAPMVAVVHVTLYGAWSDRLICHRVHVERASCLTTLDRGTVWRAALPGAGRFGVDDGDVLALRTLAKDAEHRLVLSDVNPMKSFRCVCPPDADRGAGAQGVAVALEQRERWLTLHLSWERTNHPLRLAVKSWIDDRGGRMVDERLAALEARARPAPVAFLARA
jgi:hypothetical protein